MWIDHQCLTEYVSTWGEVLKRSFSAWQPIVGIVELAKMSRSTLASCKRYPHFHSLKWYISFRAVHSAECLNNSTSGWNEHINPLSNPNHTHTCTGEIPSFSHFKGNDSHEILPIVTFTHRIPPSTVTEVTTILEVTPQPWCLWLKFQNKHCWCDCYYPPDCQEQSLVINMSLLSWIASCVSS